VAHRLWSQVARTIAADAVDPFQTHPPTKEPNVDFLMTHYFKTRLFNIFPYCPTLDINPVTEFYAPLIWGDAVLFPVTLLSSDHHIESINPCPGHSQFPKLMSETLQLLQERVNIGEEVRLSDETIAAVAGLAAIDVRDTAIITYPILTPSARSTNEATSACYKPK
jgi:hypothetical protein